MVASETTSIWCQIFTGKRNQSFRKKQEKTQSVRVEPRGPEPKKGCVKAPHDFRKMLFLGANCEHRRSSMQRALRKTLKRNKGFINQFQLVYRNDLSSVS